MPRCTVRVQLKSFFIDVHPVDDIFVEKNLVLPRVPVKGDVIVTGMDGPWGLSVLETAMGAGRWVEGWSLSVLEPDSSAATANRTRNEDGIEVAAEPDLEALHALRDKYLADGWAVSE